MKTIPSAGYPGSSVTVPLRALVWSTTERTVAWLGGFDSVPS